MPSTRMVDTMTHVTSPSFREQSSVTDMARTQRTKERRKKTCQTTRVGKSLFGAEMGGETDLEGGEA